MRRRRRAGLSTMPGREASLWRTLRSICPQVDEVFVYVDGSGPVAPELRRHGIQWTRHPLGLADNGKFLFADGFDGLYVSCDDDIVYPAGYVDAMEERVTRADDRVYAWHGSVVNRTFRDYYLDAASRTTYRYFEKVSTDRRVHIPGTGCSTFLPSALGVPLGDCFVHRRVADVEFAIALRNAGHDALVVRHPAGVMLPVPGFAERTSISGESRRGSGSDLDVRRLATRLVMESSPWPDLEGEERDGSA